MTSERITSLSGARVLIVEDEYYLADDLSRALSDAGATVIGPVATLQEAEQRLGDAAFDCAVVDMNLRGEFAFAVAERLKARNVPFVVATGYNEGSLPEALKNVPRVEKPFAPKQVIELLIQTRQNA
jgi:CheY-like chemotaxis protein